MKTTFDKANKHLNDYLDMDLTKHLAFTNPGTLRDFAVVGPLVVVYRYAEELGKRLQVRHMTVGGHQSHHVATELDFDLASKRKDPIVQLNIASDLLRIRESLRRDLNAFRIGFYFDYFWNLAADSLEKFKVTYGGKKNLSMHLGLRYKWSTEAAKTAYQGGPVSSAYGSFAFWGKGSKGFSRSHFWARRIRSWDVGFLKGRSEVLATRTISADFKALEKNLPMDMHLVNLAQLAGRM
jgi:hypothetical protein